MECDQPDALLLEYTDKGSHVDSSQSRCNGRWLTKEWQAITIVAEFILYNLLSSFHSNIVNSQLRNVHAKFHDYELDG